MRRDVACNVSTRKLPDLLEQFETQMHSTNVPATITNAWARGKKCLDKSNKCLGASNKCLDVSNKYVNICCKQTNHCYKRPDICCNFADHYSKGKPSPLCHKTNCQHCVGGQFSMRIMTPRHIQETDQSAVPLRVEHKWRCAAICWDWVMFKSRPACPPI